MKVKDRVFQILLALDQLANTFVWIGQSYADETLSARAFRMSLKSKRWNTFRLLIDHVALTIFKQEYHCYQSYLAEINKHQLPNFYRP